MSFWTAIVAIVAMMILGSVIRSRHNASVGFATDQEGKPIARTSNNDDLRREVEELRERVKVLERIATDDPQGRRLAAEIEELRQIELTDAREKEERP